MHWIHSIQPCYNDSKIKFYPVSLLFSNHNSFMVGQSALYFWSVRTSSSWVMCCFLKYHGWASSVLSLGTPNLLILRYLSPSETSKEVGAWDLFMIPGVLSLSLAWAEYLTRDYRISCVIFTTKSHE